MFGSDHPCAYIFNTAVLIFVRKVISRLADLKMGTPLKLSCHRQIAFRFSVLLTDCASVSIAFGTLDIIIFTFLSSSSSF